MKEFLIFVLNVDIIMVFLVTTDIIVVYYLY